MSKRADVELEFAREELRCACTDILVATIDAMLKREAVRRDVDFANTLKLAKDTVTEHVSERAYDNANYDGGGGDP